MNKKLKKIKNFCTQVETKYPPKTKEEWHICMKAHGADKLDMSIEMFKNISQRLDASILITNTKKTPFAFFINLKKLVELKLARR